MINIVPEGKRVYVGARKFISGQPLPPCVRMDDPDDIPEKFPDKEIKQEEKPKRGRPRKTIL